MVRIRYGRTFRTKKGRFGRYKYVNGRRVGFVPSKRRTLRQRNRFNKWYIKSRYNRRY